MEVDEQMREGSISNFLWNWVRTVQKFFRCCERLMDRIPLKEQTVVDWVQCFREGRRDPKDDARSGHPFSSCKDESINCVPSLVIGNLRIIAGTLGLVVFVHRIFSENLEMKRVCTKMVLKLLTPEQKLGWKECCIDWKTSDDSNEFLQRAVTFRAREKRKRSQAKRKRESSEVQSDNQSCCSCFLTIM